MNILLTILVIILMILAAIGFTVALVSTFFSKKRELSCACDRAASWQTCTPISDPESSTCKEIKEFIETINKFKKLFMIPFHHLKAIFMFLKIKAFADLQNIFPMEVLNDLKKPIEIAPEVLQILKELGIDITPEIIKADLGDLPNINKIEDSLKYIDEFPQLLEIYSQKIDNIMKNLNVPELFKPYIPVNFLSLIPGLNVPKIPVLNLPKIPIMGFIKDLDLENIEVKIPNIPNLEIPRISEIDLLPVNIEELLNFEFTCKVGDVYDLIKNHIDYAIEYATEIANTAVDFAKDAAGEVDNFVTDTAKSAKKDFCKKTKLC